MFHAKLTPSLSLHRFPSLQNNLFNCFYSSPSPAPLFQPCLLLFSGLLYIFYSSSSSSSSSSLAPAYLFFLPSLLPSSSSLVHTKAFWTMLPLLCTSLWKARRSWLSPPVWLERRSEGISVHKHKAIPCCSPRPLPSFSVFYNGKLAAPRTSSDSEAPSGLLTEQETKLTDVIPI